MDCNRACVEGTRDEKAEQHEVERGEVKVWHVLRRNVTFETLEGVVEYAVIAHVQWANVNIGAE